MYASLVMVLWWEILFITQGDCTELWVWEVVDLSRFLCTVPLCWIGASFKCFCSLEEVSKLKVGFSLFSDPKTVLLCILWWEAELLL